MYVYNDFAAYGHQEVIENLLSSYFHGTNLDDRWTSVAALAWFLSRSCFPWHTQDDGERVFATVDLIGNTFLNCLELLAKAGKLEAKGDDGHLEFRDVPLVMALYLKLADTLSEDMETEELIWHHHIVAYASKYSISLIDVPLKNIKKLVGNSTDEHHGVTWPEELRDREDVGLWDLKKSFQKFKKDFGTGGKIGGKQYDITKWTSAERAAKAFDEVDPIPADVRKKMESGEGELDFA